jgi:hypothetical protein
MTDAKYCSGCYNDFYNDKNDIGVKQCWNLKTAKLVDRLLIHIDQAPPYRNLKPHTVPNCYTKQRFYVAKPEDIGAYGYWKIA